MPGSLAAQFRWGISSFFSQQIDLSRHRKSSMKMRSIKFLRGIKMKMIRLLWQEDPKGLTRTAIVRFLRHGPRIFYWICLDGKIVFVDGNNTWACYKHGGSHSFFSRRAVRKLFSLAVNLKFIPPLPPFLSYDSWGLSICYINISLAIFYLQIQQKLCYFFTNKIFHIFLWHDRGMGAGLLDKDMSASWNLYTKNIME